MEAGRVGQWRVTYYLQDNGVIQRYIPHVPEDVVEQIPTMLRASGVAKLDRVGSDRLDIESVQGAAMLATLEDGRNVLVTNVTTGPFAKPAMAAMHYESVFDMDVRPPALVSSTTWYVPSAGVRVRAFRDYFKPYLLWAHVGYWPVAAMVFGFVRFRRKRRAKKGLCAGCGYDLEVVSAETCPECGRVRETVPMAKSRPAV
jgi:hypothetical protein